jgi:hypothetical protein
LSDLGWAALAAVAGIGWAAALWYLRLTTHPAVLSWERLARLRGLADQRPMGERVAARLPLLRRLQAETDIGRLLTVAGEPYTPTAWLLRRVALAAASLAVLLLLDEVSLLGNGHLAFPAGIAVAAALLIVALSYLRLRDRARRRQEALGRAVADSLPHLAVMTYHQRLPVSEALLVFARCQRDPSLHRLLLETAWHAPPHEELEGAATEPALQESTALLYERMGRTLGIPMFTALGSAVRRVTERGLSSQEVLTRLAQASYGERLGQARVAAAQTKTLIVIPMGLMIVPVLVLIGAPLVVSLSGIFSR